MSLFTARGGVPHVDRELVDPDGRVFVLPCHINYLKARVKNAVPALIFFREQDYTDIEHFIEIPVPAGEWEGPVELPEMTPPRLWVRGDGGVTDIELVVFQRRG